MASNNPIVIAAKRKNEEKKALEWKRLASKPIKKAATTTEQKTPSVSIPNWQNIPAKGTAITAEPKNPSVSIPNWQNMPSKGIAITAEPKKPSVSIPNWQNMPSKGIAITAEPKNPSVSIPIPKNFPAKGTAVTAEPKKPPISIPSWQTMPTQGTAVTAEPKNPSSKLKKSVWDDTNNRDDIPSGLERAGAVVTGELQQLLGKLLYGATGLEDNPMSSVYWDNIYSKLLFPEANEKAMESMEGYGEKLINNGQKDLDRSKKGLSGISETLVDIAPVAIEELINSVPYANIATAIADYGQGKYDAEKAGVSEVGQQAYGYLNAALGFLPGINSKAGNRLLKKYLGKDGLELVQEGAETLERYGMSKKNSLTVANKIFNTISEGANSALQSLLASVTKSTYDPDANVGVDINGAIVDALSALLGLDQ